jgi:hypothetical protein
MPQDRTSNGFIGSSCCIKPEYFTVFAAADARACRNNRVAAHRWPGRPATRRTEWQDGWKPIRAAFFQELLSAIPVGGSPARPIFQTLSKAELQAIRGIRLVTPAATASLQIADCRLEIFDSSTFSM